MRRIVLAVILLLGIVVFYGCEDDSDNLELELGSSTLRGNIVGVDEGVLVGLRGTNTRTYTDKNGEFVISGIPLGEYMLYFEVGGREYSYSVSIPEKSTIMIRNIRFYEDGSLSIDYVKELLNGDSKEPESNNNVSNDNELATGMRVSWLGGGMSFDDIMIVNEFPTNIPVAIPLTGGVAVTSYGYQEVFPPHGVGSVSHHYTGASFSMPVRHFPLPSISNVNANALSIN